MQINFYEIQKCFYKNNLIYNPFPANYPEQPMAKRLHLIEVSPRFFLLKKYFGLL